MVAREKSAFKEWREEFEKFLTETSPNKLDSFRALVNEDTLSEKLAESVLMNSDYTKKTQKLSDERKELDAKLSEMERKVSDYKSWYEETALPQYQNVKAYEDYLKQIGTIPAGGNGNGNPPPPAAGGISQADLKALQDRLEALGQGSATAISAMSQVVRRSVKEGYDIDEDRILREALQKRVSPLSVYEEHTAGQRAEKQKAELDAQLQKARDEGRKEALSKLHSPDNTTYSMPAPIVNVQGKLNDPRARQEHALSELLRLQAEGGAVPLY